MFWCRYLSETAYNTSEGDLRISESVMHVLEGLILESLADVAAEIVAAFAVDTSCLGGDFRMNLEV